MGVPIAVGADVVVVGRGLRAGVSGKGLRPVTGTAGTAGESGRGFRTGAPGSGLRTVESVSGFRVEGVVAPFGDAAVTGSNELGVIAGGSDVLGAGETRGPGDVL